MTEKDVVYLLGIEGPRLSSARFHPTELSRFFDPGSQAFLPRARKTLRLLGENIFSTQRNLAKACLCPQQPKIVLGFRVAG